MSVPMRLFRFFQRANEKQRHAVQEASVIAYEPEDELAVLLREIVTEAEARDAYWERNRERLAPVCVQRFRRLAADEQAVMLAGRGITMEDFDRSVKRRGWE